MAKSLAIAFLKILVVLLIAGLAQSMPAVTMMTIYVQEYGSGPKTSVFPIAGLPNETWGSNKFGTVFVADYFFTEGVSVDSPKVGHVQGFGAVASLDGGNIEVLVTILFTSGKYNGSTLELKGLNQQHTPLREVAVVGGTKMFRFARGYAIADPASSVGDLLSVRMNLTIVQDMPIDI